MSRKRKTPPPQDDDAEIATQLAATRMLAFAWTLATDLEVCPVCMVYAAAAIVEDAVRNGYVRHGIFDPEDGSGLRIHGGRLQ